MLNFIRQYTSRQNILVNEPMSKHTTFRIGGPADFFVLPETEQELVNLCCALHKEGHPYTVIGNGSNLLVSDSGIEGVVVCTENLSSVTQTENEIYACSGALLSSVASCATRASLSGLEFAAGIPGSTGGGIFMNAGAYGGELCDVIKFVRILKDGKVTDVNVSDCGFGYRKSVFQQNGAIILGASFALKPASQPEILEKVRDFASRRREKQPLEMPSAGSVFKRPEGHFAGKLIEDAGLRGFCCGGAGVSEKHCGFIVNNGGATAKDVIKLIQHIKKTVFDKFGVMLEEEIKLTGRGE